VHDERHRFLTKKVQQTFHGYAMAQLRKIKTHRSWLLNPPTKKPSREGFGLPVAGGTLSRDDQNRIEQSIADKIRSYGIDDIDMPRPTRIAVQERLGDFYQDVLSASDGELGERMRAVATHRLQLPPDVVSALNAEKKYRAAMKHWDAYQTWKTHRNPARAELERQHGYDTKHAMHLIRLMRMGLEVLETGDLRVRRYDADELSAIRDGEMSFDDLLAAATELQDSMQNAAASTRLPADIERDEVDELLLALVPPWQVVGGDARQDLGLWLSAAEDHERPPRRNAPFLLGVIASPPARARAEGHPLRRDRHRQTGSSSRQPSPSIPEALSLPPATRQMTSHRRGCPTALPRRRAARGGRRFRGPRGPCA
jgi:hypothetical protein